MKKLFTLFLVLIASVGTIFAWDYEHVQIGDLYYNLNKEDMIAEVTHLGYRDKNKYSDLTTVIIPESVEYGSVTYSVTSIGEWAFNECLYLTNVTIGNRVTSIEDYAFCNCGIKGIEIPNSVTSIGAGAFSNCTELTSIEIPNSVTSFAVAVFYECYKLKSVVFGNGVTCIGDETFSTCSSLTSVEIPNSVTSIGESAFNSCSSLASIEIPNSVTSIGASAFGGCSSLTSIEIPNSVTSIGESAFEYCTGLKNVIIGDGVTRIEKKAFYKCSGMENLIIGNGVNYILDYAFGGCYYLTSISSKAITPPICEGAHVFYSVKKSIPLLVHKESIDLYKHSYVWSSFENIVDIDSPTTLENVEYPQNSTRKEFIDGQLIIQKGDHTYTVTGQEVK